MNRHTPPRRVYYILSSGHLPVPVDPRTWGRWIDEHEDDCTIAHTEIGPYTVTTDFIGIATPWAEELFETHILPGDVTAVAALRYLNWEDAMLGHEHVVAAMQHYHAGRSARRARSEHEKGVRHDFEVGPDPGGDPGGA